MNGKRKFWIIGIALAAAGILVARVGSNQVDGTTQKLVLYIAGSVIAFAGLGVIMFGMKRTPEN
jgi:hypothetical protein